MIEIDYKNEDENENYYYDQLNYINILSFMKLEKKTCLLLCIDLPIKGTVSVISSGPPCKNCNARPTTVPLKP